MKILYINSFYSPIYGGGAEVSLKLIVEGVKSKGHEVCVLTTSGDKGVIEDNVDGVKVYRAGIRNIYWQHSTRKIGRLSRMAWHLRDRYNGRMRKYVRDVIRSERPDVVFCHNLGGWSISVWDEIAANNLPIVQVLHDLYLMCANFKMFKNGKECATQCFNCKMLRSNHAIESKKISAVVGVSNYVLKKLTNQGYFSMASKHVINNARDIADMGSKTPLKSGDTMKFGYIGTLASSKGLDWLIEQFLALDINATLTIAGNGNDDYVKHLHEIAKSPKIEFIGFVKSGDFYKNIDALIVPSIWPDTFPGVAFEACSYYVPVIASNIGGLPEIIKDGVNGLLCEPGDERSLGTSITKIASDFEFYNTLSMNARSSVKNLLSTERWFGEYDDLIRDVVQRNKNTVKN